MASEFNYYAVMEDTSPAGYNTRSNMGVQENVVHGETRSLRFRACLQSFGRRNRNGRLWRADMMKKALAAPTIVELIQKGDFAGENGHPIAQVGETSISRIATIDPNNVCHRITALEWSGDLVYGTVETIDDINGPGAKLMRSIMQGMEPAFSVRALVPQRKNADGTWDVTGVGRVITYDRVFLPSHMEAYRDQNVDIKMVTHDNTYQQVLESFVYPYISSHSDRVKYATDNTQVAMESAHYDPNSGLYSVNTSDKNRSRVFVPIEKRLQKEMNDLLKNL